MNEEKALDGVCRHWLRWVLVGLTVVLLTVLLGLWSLLGRYYGMVAAEASEPAPVSAPERLPAALEEPETVVLSPEEQEEQALLRRLTQGAEALPEDDADVQHILLVGCDGGAMEGVRSDSMMVLSLHRERREIILCSLMRDIYLPIPGQWTDRLNAAYAIGGPGLLMETVQYNFGIPVENFVAVDFDGFTAMMEILGGVTVELERGEAAAVNAQLSVRDEALPEDALGPWHLTPEQAFAYVRLRSLGASDFDRTARQRKILTAVAGELKGIGLPALHELAMAVLPYVKTDLSQGQIFGILLRAGEYLEYEIQSLRLPVDGSYRGEMHEGKSVLTVELDENRRVWRSAVYGEIPAELS